MDRHFFCFFLLYHFSFKKKIFLFWGFFFFFKVYREWKTDSYWPIGKCDTSRLCRAHYSRWIRVSLFFSFIFLLLFLCSCLAAKKSIFDLWCDASSCDIIAVNGGAAQYFMASAVLYSPAPLFFFFPIRADECDDSFSSFCTHNTCQMYITYIYIRIRMNWNRQKTFCKRKPEIPFLFFSMAGGQRHRRTNNKKRPIFRHQQIGFLVTTTTEGKKKRCKTLPFKAS